MKNQDSRKDRPKSCNITISPACRRSRAPRRAPMPRSSSHSPFSEAPRPSAKVCKSRFIESVSVPEIPKGPRSHEPKDIHRFSKFQDCPQRSPSHDLLSLSVLQSFQKGPEATILETFIVFESPRLSSEVPKSRFIGPVDVLEPPEGGLGSYTVA